MLSPSGLSEFTDTSERLDITVHVTKLSVISEDHPAVVGVGSDVNPVAIKTAVRVGSQSTAGPHPHRVHVISTNKP